VTVSYSYHFTNPVEKAQHNKLVALVDNMLERQIKIADTQIDRRVYDLYGLTEEEMEVVQRSYLLVLWVEVPPLQFSVGNVVISDSGWSDPMAESYCASALLDEGFGV